MSAAALRHASLSFEEAIGPALSRRAQLWRDLKISAFWLSAELHPLAAAGLEPQGWVVLAFPESTWSSMAMPATTGARTSAAGVRDRTMILGVEPNHRGLWPLLHLRLNPTVAPTMTESFPAPRLRSSAWGPGRPMAANSAGRRAFRSGVSQPDTFAGALAAAAGRASGARRQQLQPPPTGSASSPMGRRGGVLFGGAQPGRLLIAPRGHRDRLLDDRSGRQPAPLAERLGVRAWSNLDAPVEPGGTEGAKAASLSVFGGRKTMAD